MRLCGVVAWSLLPRPLQVTALGRREKWLDFNEALLWCGVLWFVCFIICMFTVHMRFTYIWNTHVWGSPFSFPSHDRVSLVSRPLLFTAITYDTRMYATFPLPCIAPMHTHTYMFNGYLWNSVNYLEVQIKAVDECEILTHYPNVIQPWGGLNFQWNPIVSGTRSVNFRKLKLSLIQTGSVQAHRDHTCQETTGRLVGRSYSLVWIIWSCRPDESPCRYTRTCFTAHI